GYNVFPVVLFAVPCCGNFNGAYAMVG
ncbi:hypothetical protein L195_g033754, partial [Trifolium pratense]